MSGYWVQYLPGSYSSMLDVPFVGHYGAQQAMA